MKKPVRQIPYSLAPVIDLEEGSKLSQTCTDVNVEFNSLSVRMGVLA